MAGHIHVNSPGQGQTTPICTADNQLNAKPRLSEDVDVQHFQFHKEDVNKRKQSVPVPNILMDIYLYRCFDTLDLHNFCKVFIEFIPSSETPVSTQLRSPKYQGK